MVKRIVMGSIEERAKAVSEGYDDDGYSAGLYMGYVVGATEQKAIDEAKLLKLKSAWEKEAQINHDDEANRKQGYHDAIEKACEWLEKNLPDIEYITNASAYRQSKSEFIDTFRKAMEEEL